MDGTRSLAFHSHPCWFKHNAHYSGLNYDHLPGADQRRSNSWRLDHDYEPGDNNHHTDLSNDHDGIYGCVHDNLSQHKSNRDYDRIHNSIQSYYDGDNDICI
jgi:hypothetical protein